MSDGEQTEISTEFAIAELVDALENLVAFSRYGTFDEVDGEADATTHAREVIARYRPDAAESGVDLGGQGD